MSIDRLSKAKAGLERTTEMTPEEYDARRAQLHPKVLVGEVDLATQEEYVRLMAQNQARRLVAETTYRPPRQLDWDDALSNADGAWLVPELIGAGTINLLVAKATIGKTFLSIDLIASAAAGSSWAGRDIGSFRTLIYLSEGQRNYARRFQAWCKANDQDLLNLRDKVRIFSDIQLTSARNLEDVRKQVEEFKPDLVVFDTFSGTSGVADENDAAIVSGVLESTRQACSPAAVLFVHHPNKASEGTTTINTRGSGTLRNNVDTVLVMYESDRRSSPHNFVTLSTSPTHGGKIKDAMPTTIGGFFLEGVDLGQTISGMPITSAVMRWTGDQRKLSKADASVLKHLTTTPMTVQDYMAAAGVSRSTAYRQLEESKLAVRLDDGRWRRLDPEDLDDSEILEDLATFIDEEDEAEADL